jgi:hypothetical protein
MDAKFKQRYRPIGEIAEIAIVDRIELNRLGGSVGVNANAPGYFCKRFAHAKVFSATPSFEATIENRGWGNALFRKGQAAQKVIELRPEIPMSPGHTNAGNLHHMVKKTVLEPDDTWFGKGGASIH